MVRSLLHRLLVSLVGLGSLPTLEILDCRLVLVRLDRLVDQEVLALQEVLEVLLVRVGRLDLLLARLV